MNSADVLSIFDKSGVRRGFQPTESGPLSIPLGAELLQLHDYITRPDLDLPLFDEKRIAGDEFSLNHSDGTKEAVRYKSMQPLVFRGVKGEVTGRMSVGDEMVFAFDSKEKLNWVRFTPYDDPQKIYQFQVTDGQVTISQYNRTDNTANLGIKPEDLDSVIAGKISNFNKLLATRVKYCRWKKNLLSIIRVDDRKARNILTAVTVIMGLTAIVLSGDLLWKNFHVDQAVVAQDSSRHPGISSPSNTSPVQIAPTPPAGYEALPPPSPTVAPTLETPDTIPEPLYTKNPDGTILFSKRINFITDERLVGPYITPKMIIVHWDGNEDPDHSKWLATTTINGLVTGWGDSATFAVGVDGIIQLVKMTETQVQSTTSSTGRDDVAINIEIAGSWFDETSPPEAEIEFAADLIARLLLTYPNLTIDDVRGHYQEDTTAEEPDPDITEYHAAVPVENPDGYEWHAPVPGVYDWGKPDPGEKFLADLKERVQKRIDELQGKTGSTALSVRTRALNQFPSAEFTLFLPPHIVVRRNKATGWQEYFDTVAGKFLTPAQVQEEIKLASYSLNSPNLVLSSQEPQLDKTRQKEVIGQSGSSKKHPTPRAGKQARASGNARLNQAQRQARVNIPRPRGGGVG